MSIETPISEFAPELAAARGVEPAARGHESLAPELGRAALGLGLAAAFGLALGARAGGPSLLHHALGVPLVLLGVAALVVPSLFVILSLFDSPLTIEKLLAQCSRMLGSTGIVLAGLAPATALGLVTIASDAAARFTAGSGLLLAAILGGAPFFAAVFADLGRAPGVARLKGRAALLLFTGFAIALAHALSRGLLPILRGGVG